MSTRFDDDDDEAEGMASVTVEALPGGRVRLRQVDGEVIELGRASAEELVRKERLQEVSRCELRARHARHRATVDWAALRRPAVGQDPADVTVCKQVARLQEPYRRVHPLGFEWWRRFCACNPPGQCLDLLRAMARVQERWPGLRADGGSADWFELLRQAIATSAMRTPAAVEARLQTAVSELAADD